MKLMPTLLATLVIFIVVVLIIRNMIKKRNHGDCGCGHCNCSDSKVPKRN
ncbi:MAG: FeoB-associated Cys-rich membrane protein [Solobacterium sp.]|nr:FeoB-associated Cys-rich membrane protein [Solobacterium sp.]